MPKFKIAYILPNIFTAGSIFLAILAVIAADNGNFERAFWLVLISALFDALDGRVARLTKTTSQFGKEFDSLADAIAFGVVPALILHAAIGAEFGKFAILVVALYTIFGAVRLARFNIIAATTEPNVFIGLPIPAAALFVVSLTTLVMTSEPTWGLKLTLLIAAAIVAFLMVSNIRYPSFKHIHFEKSYFLKILITLIALFSLFYLYPGEFLPIVVAAYVLLGPIRALWTIFRKRKGNKPHVEAES
ncbi:MAG: CDP-diacylglycerol--serine O-phosphatidyltransferase [Helicobacteraceae bacterium]|jgi:CDP-diacylglycerol--serine O-phosphatidyltransferase|nr:CDP-diacylglycerol--serine O-phosphatidyltransferase [Helicobacteraceae bacterium]